MDNNLLEIKDLHVNAGEKEILKGIDLNIKKGRILKGIRFFREKIK